MKLTFNVERARAFAAFLCALTLLFAVANARADQTLCPDCKSVDASISFDTQAGKFMLDIADFANFDYTGVDDVELELAEGGEVEIVDVSFLPGDIEYGVYETDSLPSPITGTAVTATLIFFDTTTSEEVRVSIP